VVHKIAHVRAPKLHAKSNARVKSGDAIRQLTNSRLFSSQSLGNPDFIMGLSSSRTVSSVFARILCLLWLTSVALENCKRNADGEVPGQASVALSTRTIPPSRPNRIDALTRESRSADDRQGMPVASGTSCRPDDTDAGKRRYVRARTMTEANRLAPKPWFSTGLAKKLLFCRGSESAVDWSDSNAEMICG
jgi:hypothetical protein